MSERSYAIDEIIDEKAITKGNRAQKHYLVRWEPTWEPAKQIEAEAPIAVERYEQGKECKRENKTSLKDRIEIEGLENESEDLRDAVFVVRRLSTDECFRMKYNEIRKHHSDALIDFYEKCIVNFDG
ncbi:hypothetical protein Tcan_05505 [Toxocara canis]|uniref:Chromo domain-containing protein n=2 Tax=Toxocara canis TaxID=6265 RepID=A0A0B2VIM3_TOXCA|nr:hypothetical protein Tcan_05505 [Toxocara canis]VDM44148.1 unnamed protein product [Toxocara canis]